MPMNTGRKATQPFNMQGKGFSMSVPLPQFRGSSMENAGEGFSLIAPLSQFSDGQNAVVPLPNTADMQSVPPVPNYPPQNMPPSPADPSILARIRDRMQATRARMGRGALAVRNNFADPFARYPQLTAGIPGSTKDTEQLEARDYLTQNRPRYV